MVNSYSYEFFFELSFIGIIVCPLAEQKADQGRQGLIQPDFLAVGIAQTIHLRAKHGLK